MFESPNNSHCGATLLILSYISYHLTDTVVFIYKCNPQNEDRNKF